MAAYNIVRFRVKPGKEADFVKRQRGLKAERMRGFRKGSVINAGDGTYCFIGEWDDYASILSELQSAVCRLGLTVSMCMPLAPARRRSPTLGDISTWQLKTIGSGVTC